LGALPVEILNLDDSVMLQADVGRIADRPPVDLREWGPRIRLACGFRRFQRFSDELVTRRGTSQGRPAVVLYGSGDFHHVSLALLQRLPGPLNLLVIDHHPDWMRGVPFLHCGSWLHHAARLPQVAQIFHAGGEMDFDNRYRWLAPWRFIRNGRIRVLPAVRELRGGGWRKLPTTPLRARPDEPLSQQRLEMVLGSFRDELARRPLYISIDKDALIAADGVTNWELGHLSLAEVLLLIEGFLSAAGGRLAGADTVGDWSPPVMHGALTRVLGWIEHPRRSVDPQTAARLNERTNLALVEKLRSDGRV
jgi:hypothetical protein